LYLDEKQKQITSIIEKLELEYIEELKNHILSFPQYFSDFEKLNFLYQEGMSILNKSGWGREHYRYIQITDSIIFDLDKKRFAYRNRRDKDLPKDAYRDILYEDFNIEESFKSLKNRVPISNFKIESKQLSIVLHHCYKCKVDLSYVDFKKFMESEISEEIFEKTKRKSYRDLIFVDCKEYLNRNDIIKNVHLMIF